MKRSGRKKILVFRTFSEFSTKGFEFLLRSIPTLVFFASLLFVSLRVRDSLYADHYFQASTIKIFPKGVLSPVEYAQLEKECRNQNLLRINLKHLEKIVAANPEVKKVKIERKLPGELSVFVVPRKPAVELSVSPKGEYYTVDEEGVVMSVNKTPNSKMIQWNHYNYRQKKLKVFDVYKDLSLKQLPAIIQAFQENEATKNEKIAAVNVDHLGEFSVKLQNGPEIKICEDPREALKKISAMGNLLYGEERNKVLYMNLCLNDVVVQYKTK